MQTKLENPTRYHVIEKQKSQVRQYLSQSFQQPNDIPSVTSPQNHIVQSHPGVVCAPHLNVPNNYNHQGGTTPVPLMAPNQYQGPSISPDGAAMSPSLSSVATSTSEVSLVY